jgi:hypothetical protein
VLDSSVRHRANFANGDSGRGTQTLATNTLYAHALLKYSDAELQTILSVSRVRGAPSTSFSTYKEMQVHGAIELRSDVQLLAVPGREHVASDALKRDVGEFQKRNPLCNVLWQGDCLDT